MPIDDEQLDDLLRDISVPADLKATLLEIPDRDSEAISVPLRSKSYAAMLGTIAAIAATVLVFLYMGPTRVAKVPVPDDSVTVEMLLAQLEQNQEAMKKVAEIQEMANQETQSFDTDPIYDPNETVALALSMAWQSSLDQGASFDSVKGELESLVASYPGTRGAEQARQILQIN